MAKNQREATFEAIVTVLSNSNVSFTPGSNVKSVLTSDHKKQVRQILINGFKSGTVEHTQDFAKTKLNSDTELNKYCSGLISNWVKKDNRLNGNVKYQTVNTGTRVGSSDPQVKELRKLLKATAGTAEEKDVNEALNARLAQVKSTKTPKISIDVEAIPENLKHLVK
jgi:hypothetical protein